MTGSKDMKTLNLVCYKNFPIEGLHQFKLLAAFSKSASFIVALPTPSVNFVSSFPVNYKIIMLIN